MSLRAGGAGEHVVQPRIRHRAVARALLLVATTLLLPGRVDADTIAAEPARPFDIRVLMETSSGALTPFCALGTEHEGVALDVRDGTFDGIWWSSTCLSPQGMSGSWFIYYIGGQAVSLIGGTWRSSTLLAGDAGAGYTGTYTLTYGFGPWDGIAGGGEFTVYAGLQQWAVMTGQFSLPSS